MRQKFCSKKQVFQITNKLKTKEELEHIVDEAIKKLEQGMSEQDATKWAKKAASELS